MSNPHKTKHVLTQTISFWVKVIVSIMMMTANIGITKTFNAPFYLDVIGTSHCRSRAIACTKDEYNIFLNNGEVQKQKL